MVGALDRGMIDQMVRNAIATLTGDIQIHHDGYRSDPVIENSIADPKDVHNALARHLPEGSFWTARVRVNAIVSNARYSTGVTLVGIDPESEARVSFIKTAVVDGHYLASDDTTGILVGRALVDKFETKVGHKLVLMSQDTEREIASRAFRITGTFRAELEATERQFVFVNKAAAQEMLKAGNGISEVSLFLPDHETVDMVRDKLKASLPPAYEVETWRELLPIITAYLSIMDSWIFIWYLVVFIAMGFGIVNTMLMAVFERIREFGLLTALGMKPWWIIKGVLLEAFFLLIMGMAVGNAFGFASVFILNRTGIDLSALGAGAEYVGLPRVIYPMVYIQDVITANVVVFVLGLLITIYPAAKASRFTPVEALAHI